MSSVVWCRECCAHPKGGAILECVGWEGTWAGPRDGRRDGRYPTVSGVSAPTGLAMLDPIDSEAIARQLASELNLPMRNTLVDFVRKLVQDSKEPAKLAARADGQLASYVDWINTWGVPEVATEIVSEWVPPVGTKKLRSGKAIATEEEREFRQQRLLDIWTEQLLQELRLMDAQCWQSWKTAWIGLRPGKIRATTMKRYVSYYRQ